MLKEEFYHLLTGNTGLMRTVKAGKIPIPIIQKYFNKWISTAYDLFGKDHSTSALRFYRWGLKGRFDEEIASAPAKHLERLNEEARSLYFHEIREIIDGLNQLIPAESTKIHAPDIKFNRRIGDYADKTFGVDGNWLDPEEYRRHLEDVLPSADDQQILQGIFREGDWITAVKKDA